MKIRVADITEKEKLLQESQDAGCFPTLAMAQDSGECRFLSPVASTLTVVKEFDHIRVHGNVATTASFSCSRCLKEYTSDIASSFTIFYTKSAAAQPEDEVELDEQDLVSATYSGDEIDFTDEIAEQLLLELPYKPLCSEACRGLCTTCGADLNVSSCACSEKNISMKFSSLKGLKVKQ